MIPFGCHTTGPSFSTLTGTVPDALHTLVFPSWNWMLATLIDDSASRSYRTRVVEECADLFICLVAWSRPLLPALPKFSRCSPTLKKCVVVGFTVCETQKKKKKAKKKNNSRKLGLTPETVRIGLFFSQPNSRPFLTNFVKKAISSFLCDPSSPSNNVNETWVLGSQGPSTRGCMREWSPRGSGTKICAGFGVVCTV